MKRVSAKGCVFLSLVLISVFMVGTVLAADIKDGHALINPAPDDRYAIDGFIFAQADLSGYMNDLKQSDQITGIVLRRGKSASEAQRRGIAEIAATLQLEAFEQDGRKLTPLQVD